MGLSILDWDTLGDLQGGFLRRAVREELEQINRDIGGRPAVATARKLTIELAFTPASSQQGICEEAALEIGLKASMPKQAVSCRSLDVHASGHFQVRVDSPDDVRQSTFADVDQRNPTNKELKSDES